MMFTTIIAKASDPEGETEDRIVCAKQRTSYTSFRWWPSSELDDCTRETWGEVDRAQGWSGPGLATADDGDD